MEHVNSFNAELTALYDVKPPISKAKMTAITRGAIKAIKFYKHVVQSVEKFIQKCKPEYKVPGLYVIDSIVRQSRHQFGIDKDVFAPRFAKNMQGTFLNLYRCPPEDRSKIVRVLNLWQKNAVFQSEVIQPLFDLADPNNPIHKEAAAAAAAAANSNGNPAGAKSSPSARTPTKTDANQVAWSAVQEQIDATNSAIMHLSGQGTGKMNANLPGQMTDSTLVAQLQQLQQLMMKQQKDKTAAQKDAEQVKFNKKLLEFDYSDDEDETGAVAPSPAPAPGGSEFENLLANPEVLRQLHTLQAHMQQAQADQLEKTRKLQEMQQQEDAFDMHLALAVPNLPFASECELKPMSEKSQQQQTQRYDMFELHKPVYTFPGTNLSLPPPGYAPAPAAPAPPTTQHPHQRDHDQHDSEVEFVETRTDDNQIEIINLDRSRSRSPSASRHSKRRRSRSRSRDHRRGRKSRSRSRSTSRTKRRRSRSKEKEKEKERERDREREKDKERKKKGLPPIKLEHLSVCSTTLWVGHLSKLVHQEELSDTFGEYGDIVSIDLIPPRGCAFICMNRRQDAYRALTKLKSFKLQGKQITLAWAPGKGVKGRDWKDYWEVELGVSYIPWSKLTRPGDMDIVEEGGVIDEDTVPEFLRVAQAQARAMTALSSGVSTPTVPDVSTPSFIPLPESSAPTPTPSGPDTSQPPPHRPPDMPPPPGMNGPPPGAMGLMSPFGMPNMNSMNSMNNMTNMTNMTNVPRLLGQMGLPMGHGMMGVPPPGMQGLLLPMMSGFQPMLPPHGALSTIPLPSPAAPQGDKLGPGLPSNGPPTTEASLPGRPFGVPNFLPPGARGNDDMDVDDDHKEQRKTPPERFANPPLLSDQLLAAIRGQTFPMSMPPPAIHRPEPEQRSRDADGRSKDQDGGRNRERGRDREDRDRDRGGRDRERNRWGDRDKDRDRRDRDRDKDRDGKDSWRNKDSDDRDSKGELWGSSAQAETKGEPKLSLTDRLLSLAAGGLTNSRDSNRNDSNSRDSNRNDSNRNDSSRNDSNRNDSNRNDSNRNDSNRNDSSRDSNRNDSNRNDSNRNDSNRNDSSRNDSKSDSNRSGGDKSRRDRDGGRNSRDRPAANEPAKEKPPSLLDLPKMAPPEPEPAADRSVPPPMIPAGQPRPMFPAGPRGPMFAPRGPGGPGEGFRMPGPDGFRPQGPDGFRPQGPDGFRPQGPDGFRPQGPDGFRPQGPGGFRPMSLIDGMRPPFDQRDRPPFDRDGGFDPFEGGGGGGGGGGEEFDRLPRGDGFRPDFDPRPDEFMNRQRGPPMADEFDILPLGVDDLDFRGDEFNPRGPPRFDDFDPRGPPRDGFPGHPDDFPPDGFPGGPDEFDRRGMRPDFDPRGHPDFFGPHGPPDNFGPHGMMGHPRRMGPDNFGPRPLLRGPGPMFPRGPGPMGLPPSGPRPGMWMDNQGPPMFPRGGDDDQFFGRPPFDEMDGRPRNWEPPRGPRGRPPHFRDGAPPNWRRDDEMPPRRGKPDDDEMPPRRGKADDEEAPSRRAKTDDDAAAIAARAERRRSRWSNVSPEDALAAALLAAAEASESKVESAEATETPMPAEAEVSVSVPVPGEEAKVESKVEMPAVPERGDTTPCKDEQLEPASMAAKGDAVIVAVPETVSVETVAE